MTRRPSPQSRPRGGRRAKAPTLTTGRLSVVEVLRCQLTEMDRSAYPTDISDDQWDRLQLVFPNGVCDWPQPGIGQVPLVGTWLGY